MNAGRFGTFGERKPEGALLVMNRIFEAIRSYFADYLLCRAADPLIDLAAPSRVCVLNL